MIKTLPRHFDPEWMFDIADGFDIVIGNPPFVLPVMLILMVISKNMWKMNIF